MNERKGFQQGCVEILCLRMKSTRKTPLMDFRQRWIEGRIETNFVLREPQFRNLSLS